MKYCDNCGHQMEDDELFCAECGTRWVSDEATKVLAPKKKPHREEEPVIQEPEQEKPSVEPAGARQAETDQAEALPKETEPEVNEPAIETPIETPPVTESVSETETRKPEGSEAQDTYVTAKLDEPVYCPNCGMKNEPGGTFCESCGAPLTGPVPEPEVRMEKPAQSTAQPEPVYCPNCGMKNEPDGVFCQNCGAPLKEENPGQPEPKTEPAPVKLEKEPVFCPACGFKNDADDMFCQNCGANLHDQSGQAVTPPPAKKKSKLPVILGGVAAVVVIAAAAGFGISHFKGAGDGKETPYLHYYKDGAIYQYNTKSGKGLEMTKKALADESATYAVPVAMNQIINSKDGKYAFYMENYDFYSGKLYFMDLKKQSDKNDTAQKIDNGVSIFNVTDDNRVVYRKTDNNTLYVYDIKKDEKDKLASDVSTFYLSEDGKDMIYITTDQELYYKKPNADADKEKLDSDVSLYYWSDDLKTLYYMKDDNIYYIKDFGDKEKVVSDASIIGSTPDKKGIYYTVDKDPIVTVEDIIVDELAQSDASMQEPKKENYVKQEKTWSGSTRTVTDYDAFNAARAEYQKKQDRDNLRAEIENFTYSYINDCRDVYYFDGTEHELMKNAFSVMDIGTEDYIYCAYGWDQIDLPSIKLSEVESANDLDSKIIKSINEILQDGIDAYLLADGIAIPFSYEGNAYYSADGETKTIYATTYTMDEETYEMSYDEIYSLKYSDKGVEKPVTIDSDLGENFSSEYVYGGKFYYYKDFDYEDYAGTLYCNGEEIDEDVYCFSYDEDSGKFYYMNDESKSNCGTLYCLGDKKPAKLAEDVAYFAPVDDGGVAILSDYSTKRSKGELKLISNKDGKVIKKIDEDVSYMQNATGSLSLPY